LRTCNAAVAAALAMATMFPKAGKKNSFGSADVLRHAQINADPWNAEKR
jgi:hypothetical protein